MSVHGRKRPDGALAELATPADYIRAPGGELRVIAGFGGLWRRVA